MKTNFLLYSILIGILTCTAACEKFLDVAPPTTSINPTRIKDFQEILNNDSLARTSFFMVDLMSDDIELSSYQIDAANNVYQRSYLWKDTIWNPAENDYIYNNTYRRILQMNVILSRLESAPNDDSNTEENKSIVRSQALINRASYYLQLVNTYGKSYTESTAETDLGVPLVLVPDANTLLPRSSLKTIYSRIVDDLKIAVDNPYLPSKGRDIIHPGKAAGYALLARTYLYMSDYENALTYADQCLALENSLRNYNSSYTMVSELPDLAQNPEVLLGRIGVEIGFYSTYNTTFQYSPDLVDLYRTGPYGSLVDTRYTKSLNWGSFPVSTAVGLAIVSDNSIAVPEVLLTKAECLARRGNTAESGAIIDRIRENRIPADALESRVYTSSNILTHVLQERRRELPIKGGLRWFDLKRLNKEPAHSKELIRMKSYTTDVIATLSPGSPRYLMPFSSLVTAANQHIIQNPRK